MALFLVGVAGSAWAEPPCVDGTSRLREAEVELRRLGTTSARLHVEGILPVYAGGTVDPATDGFRVLFGPSLNGDTAPELVDLAVPGGAGWETPRPGRWVYRARVAAGVRRVVVQEIEAPVYGVARTVTIAVDAIGLTLPPLSDLEQTFHQVMVLLDATGSAGACGSRNFYPRVIWETPEEPFEPAVWEPRCTLRSKGRTMSCFSGPRGGPCKVSHPLDLMRCDAWQAAIAQESYFAIHGHYFTGDCDDLPGMMPSPNVECATHGTAETFSASTEHTGGWQSCDVSTGHPIFCR